MTNDELDKKERELEVVVLEAASSLYWAQHAEGGASVAHLRNLEVALYEASGALSQWVRQSQAWREHNKRL